MQGTKPPDGGWGWIVALCSFVNHALIFGILFSMSVVYVSWLEEFDNSNSTTSWIISTCAALIFLSGPIAGSVAARYGYRFTATLGGVLAAVGLILCYFATSVLYLIITIGVITGLSCGFVYLSSLAIVVIYFDRKRALATGIGISGVGIGSFCLPQLMNALVESYGWRGCLLIVGGLLLNLCVTGALMRPLAPKVSERGLFDKIQNVRREEGGKGVDDDEEDDDEKWDGKRFEDMARYDAGVHRMTALLGVESQEKSRELDPPSTGGFECREDSEGLFYRKGSGGFRGKDYNNMATSFACREGENQEVLIARMSHIKHSKTAADGRYDLDLLSDTSANNIAADYHLLSHSDEILSISTDLDDTKVNTLNGLVLLSRSAPTLGTIISPNNRYCDYPHSRSIRKSTSKPAVDQKHSGLRMRHSPQASESKRRCYATFSIIRLHIKAMKDGAFLLFSISQILVTFSFLTPVVYMVDRAIDNGISKSQGAWLISCNGVGSLVGRLLLGAMADRYKSCSLMFYTVLLSATGVFTMMSPLCGGSIFLHGAYAAIFGLGMGGVSTLCVVIVVDLVGLSKMATALGILLWFAGIGHLVGPPFAGFIFDVTQSYTICYVAQGFVLTCSGLMLLPIFRIRSDFCCHGASRDMT